MFRCKVCNCEITGVRNVSRKSDFCYKHWLEELGTMKAEPKKIEKPPKKQKEKKPDLSTFTKKDNMV